MRVILSDCVPIAVLSVLILIAAAVDLYPEEALSIGATSVVACGQSAPATSAKTTPMFTYEVVTVFPHDAAAFTQGLIFENGVFYESTGLEEQSSVRKVEPATGRILRQYLLPAQYFGEGLTAFQGRLIQLTWRSHVGFVYDQETFQLIEQFSYPTEGWGLTHDGTRLILSDGSDTLHFLDPHTFREIGRISVHDQSGMISGLNELEYVQGEVFANIWLTDRIARIDPGSGRVTGWINLEGLLLLDRHDPFVQVLNGIAYDDRRDRLFVTGKLWPKLFEIKLLPLP
ncbi:MAG TPA: glutaminyl-peptide cyclotransferase [Thermodesulfobacteriota bacterium]|nr:glutaminyl-peptide cyclotransferase [Deltaproteobacteria bacterium]HOC38176.1 glutaminyl-peptide cyclotransferase [Thermodesulfobacteriota bacterium]